MPRAATAPKEDLRQHHRLQRQLNKNDAQRQEYHLVNIDMAEAREYTPRGEPTGITHGEHDVRRHDRHYRNPDGTIRKTISIAAHKRGSGPMKSKRAGYVVKTLSPQRIWNCSTNLDNDAFRVVGLDVDHASRHWQRC